MKVWLERPELSLLPRESWPERLPVARVRCGAEEWEKVCLGFYKRGIFDFIEDSSLLRRRGEPLLNGMFALPKGSVTDPGFDPQQCPLRTICNAIPSNSVHQAILGEIRDLPLHTLWHS